MNFHIARTSAATGNILRQLVEDKARESGVDIRANVHVCYGVGSRGTQPTLNGNCSAMNKLQQGFALIGGLRPGEAIRIADTAGVAGRLMRETGLPLLSRKIVHSRGRDIEIVVEDWQLQPRLDSGADFFSVYEASVKEFRTWVYRNRHLGTYEKVLRRPADFVRLGRNHANGFDFSKLDNEVVPEGLKDVCKRAVASLNLDFGAVDLIQRVDGSYCVLEVNTAPGVSDAHRAVIVGLAHRVVRWAANGYPARGN